MATPWWFPRFSSFFSWEWCGQRAGWIWGEGEIISPVDWLVVSNIFYVHPYLGKWSNLTNLLQMGWNHHLVDYFEKKGGTLDYPFGTLLLVPSRERSHIPPKEKRKIIDSLCLGMGYVTSWKFNMSPLKSYLGPNITGKEKVFLSLHFSGSMLNFGGVCIYIYIYIYIYLGGVVESPSDDGMNIIIKNMLSD